MLQLNRDDDVDDSLQVVVCGTSDEGNLVDFAREHGIGLLQPASGDDDQCQSNIKKQTVSALKSGNKRVKWSNNMYSWSNNGENKVNSQVVNFDNMDREAIIDYMTGNKKVIMEWELNGTASDLDDSRNMPWYNAKNKSFWFNYGLDEFSFKEWIQRQLDERLTRADRHKIENLYEDNHENNGTKNGKRKIALQNIVNPDNFINTASESCITNFQSCSKGAEGMDENSTPAVSTLNHAALLQLRGVSSFLK